MNINSTDKFFGSINYLGSDNVGTDIWMTDSSEGIMEIISSDVIIVHETLENTIENVGFR